MLREIFENLDLHCSKWDNYFDVYEKHFEKFIGKSPVIVEVGICQGGSAEMWKKYFGEGVTVVGIDIQDCSKYSTDGCIQIIGDQSSSSFWDDFLIKYPSIDIFIDDGSHYSSHQKLTLSKVWPHINDGGVYLCEDTHTNIWPEFGSNVDNESSFLNFSKKLTDVLLYKHFRGPDNKEFLELVDFYKNISSINFYDSVVVFTKNKETPINNVWSRNPS